MLKPGDKVLVSIRGRDGEGNYLLSTIKVETPRDWSGLEAAFAAKRTIGGTVLEVVKGGLRVDVGVRAFMPASRSGAREQAELEKLVGQEIECRITKLDTEPGRRGGGPPRGARRARASRPGKKRSDDCRKARWCAARCAADRFRRVRRSGRRGRTAARFRHGVCAQREAVATWSRWARRSKSRFSRSTRDAEDRAGVEAACAGSRGRWSAEKYPQGARVKGKVSRVADFGAFVELEPGIEGLIHVSEMSWTKKNVRPRTSSRRATWWKWWCWA